MPQAVTGKERLPGGDSGCLCNYLRTDGKTSDLPGKVPALFGETMRAHFDYGNWVRDGSFYPKEILTIAKNRTAGLLKPWNLQTASLSLLIESAYLQGPVDGAQAVKSEQEANDS
jgi:hypothetical protein